MSSRKPGDGLGPTGADVADEDWPIHPFPMVAWRDVAEAMREGQRAARVEPIPPETARVCLGLFADALVLDQQASGNKPCRCWAGRPRRLRSLPTFSPARTFPDPYRFGTVLPIKPSGQNRR